MARGGPSTTASAISHQEPIVRLDANRIHVRDHAGAEPAIVVMHCFADNLHLYTPARRVVSFDLLGWGASDRPAGDRRTAAKQTREVDAVIKQLRLDPVVLVAHDASGPPAIDWALAHPDRVAGLVRLNTYYQWTWRLRRPEAIALYSTPIVRSLARHLVRRFDVLDRELYFWQVGRFIRDAEARSELVPFLYSQFRAARQAFWELEQRPDDDGAVAPKDDSQDERLHPSGPDHLRRRGSLLEPRRG